MQYMNQIKNICLIYHFFRWKLSKSFPPAFESVLLTEAQSCHVASQNFHPTCGMVISNQPPRSSKSKYNVKIQKQVWFNSLEAKDIN